MAKTKKSMRALAFIITVMMIACLAPTVSFAANTVTMDDIVADGNSITVGGSIEKGAELTMLAVRANAELTSLSGMSDADLEKAIMYIDQVTMGDEKYTKTFELRDSAEGNVITVFMGGTDAAMVYKSYKMITAAGTVEINGTDFVAGTTEPKLKASDETWFATLDKAIYVKGDEEKNSAGNVAADGTITIDTPSNEKTTYVVELTTPDGSDYAAFTKTFEFTYITADGDKISKLPANLGVTVDKDSNAAKYTITVPADDNGIVYSATVDGADQDLTSRTFDVERPADDGNDETTLKKTVVVTATAGTATKTYTIEVLEQGAAAPAIKAEYVTLTAQAYGIEGAKVVTIAVPEAEIDPETNKIVVDGVELLYAPERRSDSKYRFVGIIRDAAVNADAEAVANAATIEDGVAAKLYYGKPSNPSSDTKLFAADVARALSMFKAGKYDSAYTPAQYLAADVIGNGSVQAAHVARLLAAFKSVGSADKSGFNIIAK